MNASAPAGTAGNRTSDGNRCHLMPAKPAAKA